MSEQQSDPRQGLREAVEALHRSVPVYELADYCADPGHMDEHQENEDGEWLCFASPTGDVLCAECRDQDGDRVAWPCATAALLAAHAPTPDAHECAYDTPGAGPCSTCLAEDVPTPEQHEAGGIAGLLAHFGIPAQRVEVAGRVVYDAPTPAHAREDVPYLLHTVDDLRKRLGEARSAHEAERRALLAANLDRKRAEADLGEMTREARLSREATEKAVAARRRAEADLAAAREARDQAVARADEMRERRERAIEQCRHLHQDDLPREEWHLRTCGAFRALREVQRERDALAVDLAAARGRGAAALREAAAEMPFGQSHAAHLLRDRADRLDGKGGA
jgi:hypothetical protein